MPLVALLILPVCSCWRQPSFERWARETLALLPWVPRQDRIPDGLTRRTAPPRPQDPPYRARA